MRVLFRESFEKDLSKIRDKRILQSIQHTIIDLESITSIHETNVFRKIRGYDTYFRIRVGVFRIGVTVERGTITFVRILHRKEIYRYFP